MRKTLRERLTDRLAAVGLTVRPADFMPAKGSYRTNAQLDCHLWEASGFFLPEATESCPAPTGFKVHIASFSRMTDCARYGITIERMTGVMWVEADLPPSQT